MPNDYNDTLNLPQTDFPMRAGLPQREPEFLNTWESENLYQKIIGRNVGKPIYLLHDGPPYANGDIHLGHALNKILKDFVVRYKNMAGFRAPFVPGWDTHGLPTELKARTKAGIKNSQEISDVELRRICKEFAMKYVESQKEQFKRLGVMGDWDNPYITLQPEFEKKQIEVFAQMADKGCIYRGLKPVHWCTSCETAIAEAEIEYHDDDCDSIYVKFKVKEDFGKLKSLGADLGNTYFVIWTTTAWTLPGNVAICVGPEFDYALVKSNKDCYVIASDLVEQTMDIAGISDYKVVGKVKGSDLEYIQVFHPFLDRTSLVILGEHVTLDSGTGCVHTAPGHGVEDFDACSRYKDIPVIVPVDSHGVLTEEAGPFCGLKTAKASEAITEYLKDSDLLFSVKKINHQYPHCWRCKKPILFRATQQWFCSVEQFKNTALEAIKHVSWIPKWGQERITSMVSERKDWCISRQRKWGTPIPIFFCEKCDEPLISKDAMLKVANIFGQEGSDAWFEKSAQEFIPSGCKCKKCGHEKFRKETDIMDVWFDSGVTHAYVCNEGKGLKWPADLYLEGADQYRGWFQSSLITAVAERGSAPYKAVATHGWVVDEEGKKQSKSLGNGVDPNKVVKEYGADILRLWVASADYHADVKISYAILKQLSESYRKIRNTARYIIGNLYDFNPDTDCLPVSELYDIDKWALVKLNNLITKSLLSYENLDFHNVYHSIYKFSVVDMSNFYLDILKDRLYVYGKGSKERRCAQTCIYIILDSMVRLLAPILPFTTEEIWQNMPHKSSDDKSHVMLNDMPKVQNLEISDEFLKDWEYIVSLSSDIKKALELSRKDKVIGSPLEAKVCIYCSKSDFEFISSHTETLKTVLIVSEVEAVDTGSENTTVEGVVQCETMKNISLKIGRAPGNKCSRCWAYSVTVGRDTSNPELCDKCVNILKGN